MVKLFFNGVYVFKNIRAIKLQVVEHTGARSVVNEFAAFIKEGRIVLIGLQ
jgi:hypothetical protein